AGYGVIDGSGRGHIGAGCCSDRVGSANYDPKGRGDYRIEPAGPDITGRRATERFANSAAPDNGF
nr:hypothetical protein [Tanacetum cinerariifolium]